MNVEQQKSIARGAIQKAKEKYGRGWAHISEDAKVGTVVRIIVADFKVFAPETRAFDVAEAVQAATEMVIAET